MLLRFTYSENNWFLCLNSRYCFPAKKLSLQKYTVVAISLWKRDFSALLLKVLQLKESIHHFQSEVVFRLFSKYHFYLLSTKWAVDISTSKSCRVIYSPVRPRLPFSGYLKFYPSSFGTAAMSPVLLTSLFLRLSLEESSYQYS